MRKVPDVRNRKYKAFRVIMSFVDSRKKKKAVQIIKRTSKELVTNQAKNQIWSYYTRLHGHQC